MMNITPESVLSALVNSTRLRCVLLLMEHGELCVCELNHVIGGAQPNMSRNLGLLREAGIVTDRREGQWIYYQINPDLPDWVFDLISATAKGAEKLDPYQSDKEALSIMPGRPGTNRCA
jgi:ArsR family transcriptional regulator